MSEKQKRVLCVDNDDDICQMVKTMLSLKGYDVTTALSVEECFAVVEREHFDLFVLDYHYPEMTGLDLCEQLHQKYPDTPVMFFTGEAREQVKQEALECADAYLVKPNDIGNLTPTADRLTSEAA